MATSRTMRFRRIIGDGVFFGATVLLAYWAMIDRSPGWLMAVYITGALIVAVAARRLLVRLRDRRDAGGDSPHSNPTDKPSVT
jgi:hypothetical protein